MTDPQLRSPRAAVAKSPPGRTVEPPLDILLISVWRPSAQSSELPSGASEGGGRKHLEHERDEDSLLTNAELAVGALSSILRDSDLKKADSMSVEEALALSLQGVVFFLSILSLILIGPYLCLVSAGGYLHEKLGEEGLFL